MVDRILKPRCIYWANIALLLSFTSLCIATGSVGAPEVKRGLAVGEQVCQAIFLLLLVISMARNQQGDKLWLALDLMTVAATFLSSHL